MCQFNLIFVNNFKNEKLLKTNGYNSFEENFKDYSAFATDSCNCGSFVTSMSEYDGDNYSEMINDLNTTELKRLNTIKEFMSKPNYKELKEKFLADKAILASNLEKFFEPISNYEMEQIDLLKSKYTGEEFGKQLNLLYKEIDKKLQKIENSSEYKEAEEKFEKFLEDNQLMDDSTLYYLTAEEEAADKEIFENILADELSDEDLLNEPIEEFDEEEESMVIDTIIEKIKNKSANDYEEFSDYKKLFEELLKNEDAILFGCIWDEPGKFSIVKEVNFNDLKIEDLASLEYNQIVKIYK